MINEIQVQKIASQAVSTVANHIAESGSWNEIAYTECGMTTHGLILDTLKELAPTDVACRRVIHPYIDGSLPMFTAKVIALVKTMVTFPSISPLRR